MAADTVCTNTTVVYQEWEKIIGVFILIYLSLSL